MVVVNAVRSGLVAGLDALEVVRVAHPVVVVHKVGGRRTGSIGCSCGRVLVTRRVHRVQGDVGDVHVVCGLVWERSHDCEV